jgi:hypothetical protein
LPAPRAAVELAFGVALFVSKYGAVCLLLRQDMFFGTCTDNSMYEVGGHVATLQRAADAAGHDVFFFTPLKVSATAAIQSK